MTRTILSFVDVLGLQHVDKYSLANVTDKQMLEQRSRDPTTVLSAGSLRNRKHASQTSHTISTASQCSKHLLTFMKQLV